MKVGAFTNCSDGSELYNLCVNLLFRKCVFTENEISLLVVKTDRFFAAFIVYIFYSPFACAI